MPSEEDQQRQGEDASPQTHHDEVALRGMEAATGRSRAEALLPMIVRMSRGTRFSGRLEKAALDVLSCKIFVIKIVSLYYLSALLDISAYIYEIYNSPKPNC